MINLYSPILFYCTYPSIRAYRFDKVSTLDFGHHDEILYIFHERRGLVGTEPYIIIQDMYIYNLGIFEIRFNAILNQKSYPSLDPYIVNAYLSKCAAQKWSLQQVAHVTDM